MSSNGAGAATPRGRIIKFKVGLSLPAVAAGRGQPARMRWLYEFVAVQPSPIPHDCVPHRA